MHEHKEQHGKLARKEAFTFQLKGCTRKQQRKEIFFSTPFDSPPGGYRVCIRIDANGYGDGKGTHLSFFTKLLKDRFDNKIIWFFLGTVTYELLNQLEDSNHHNRVIIHDAKHDMRVGSICYGYSKFLPHSSLGHKPATNTQYLLDDTQYFRVSVKVDNHKPWLVCTDCEFNRSTENKEFVIFHVIGYSKLKANNSRIRSNSFYTRIGGYHMVIIVDANGFGNGKGTHLSVFTELLEDHYDNQLRWPFLGIVTYEHLNQLEDNNHHSVELQCDTSQDMRVGCINGYLKFLPHSSLSLNPATNTQYLLDDTLYFRVSVKVDNHNLWLVCTQSVIKDS